MTGHRVVKTLHMAKGLRMSILLDDSQPEDSLDRWTTEVVCDGGPDSDPLCVPRHWHRYHSERMSLLEGRVEATMGSETRTFNTGEEFTIPAGVAHGIRGFAGERLVLRETADPPGVYKSLFFNDLFPDQEGAQMGGFWHAMRTQYDGDTYPALPLYFRFFDVAFVTFFGGIAKLFMAPKSHEKLE